MPQVRVATVKATSGELVVSLPATTSAFAAANILARASGYIATRSVDIGDRVKAGEQLATIVAPELDHQIAQAEATLGPARGGRCSRPAPTRSSRSVTWRRDEPLVKEGWLPKQQGTVDVQTLRANDAAVERRRSQRRGPAGALQVLQQQKAYQSVVAPFDGVITQRNIDIGSLVQADAVNSTFMFTILQSNVVRTQVYVPQDAASGVAPGIDAVIRVPELPDHPFPGKVTRIADALQPGTRTLLVEIDIANPDGLLSTGIYAPPSCTFRARRRASPCPPARSSSTATACRWPSSRTAWRICARSRSARDRGTEVEVVDGVKAGDRVILNPAVELSDGDRVETRT